MVYKQCDAWTEGSVMRGACVCRGMDDAMLRTGVLYRGGEARQRTAGTTQRTDARAIAYRRLLDAPAQGGPDAHGDFHKYKREKSATTMRAESDGNCRSRR